MQSRCSPGSRPERVGAKRIIIVRFNRRPSRPRWRGWVITVRPNRLRCALIAFIGLPLSLGLILFDPESGDRQTDDLWRTGGTLLLGLTVGCLPILFRRWYFTFDARIRRVTVSGRWDANVYPRNNFERIEYSVYDARIYVVKAGGKRRRLPVRRWFANPRDWEVFVDRILAVQAQSAEESGG